MTASKQGRPLRIVLVLGTLRIGGTETQVARLACDLKGHGHEVRVVALAASGPLEEYLRERGVPITVFAHGGLRLRDEKGWRAPRTLWGEGRELFALWRHFRRLRPDVCHAFNFTCYTLALPIARAAGVPVRISGRRGEPPRSPTGLRRHLLDSVSRLCSSAFVCNSRAGADILARTERVRENRITVIPNSLDIPVDVADAGRQPPRGVVVASLYYYKGHADLIAALSMLREPPHLCFIGDGPERTDIENRLRRAGLEDTVELAGAVTRAARLLGSYQFAVLPSHEEGLPNAVLEAMAAGLPVIATAVGGVPEVVVDGVTGLLVEPHAPRALAGAIERLAGDPDLRRRMGTAGRLAAERLSALSPAHLHEAVYRAARR